MDGHLSESFIEELFQLEDEESFYKKLGLPVMAAEESENEISENFEESRDEIDVLSLSVDEVQQKFETSWRSIVRPFIST